MAIEFKANLASTPIPLKHSWEHTVGNGRALLALRADSQAQLMRVHGELGFLHLRSHGVLDDEMGTLISHAGKPLYSFFNTDQINDYLLSIGMRPFVELSFMPSMLASGSSTVFQYCANITPPRDYRQWGKLIDRLVCHWIDRYGLDEIREWYFEVWNEPNLSQFWSGGKKAYEDLYRTTVETIKNVDSRLK